MAKLTIKIFKDGDAQPKTTVTIPLAIVRVAAKMIPPKAISGLQEIGIDTHMIAELARQDDVRGTLVEIEEHLKKEKIVIAIE